MKVLVTGGSGFIGRHLVRGLGAGHEVLAPAHRELDLSDAHGVQVYLEQHRPDAVVHAAVKPGHRNAPDRQGLLTDNLTMFFNLVRERSRYGRLVVISSGALYDVRRALDRVAEDEAGRHIPADEHGLSKLVEALLLRGDDDATELRLFGVYGPGEDYAIRFISNACCKAMYGLPITLRQDRRFSYLWVEDLAAVVEQALAGAISGAFNVVPPEALGLREIATLVLGVAGKDLPIAIAQDGEGLPYVGANDGLRAVLPGLRFTSVHDGVERLYDWYSQHASAIKRDLLLTDK